MPSRELPLDESGLLSRFDQIFSELQSLSAAVEDLHAEVGRVPPVHERGDRRSITERMHDVEAQTSPAAMEAAVVRAIRQLSGSLWTTSQKVFLYVITAVGAVAGLLKLFGVG